MDDRRTLAQGLVAVLRTNPEVESVEWILRPDDVNRTLHEASPNVVMIDAQIRGVAVIEFVAALTRSPNAPAVVMLTDGLDPGLGAGLIRAGAVGFVSMAESTDDLVNALKAALSGMAYFPTRLLQSLVADPGSSIADRDNPGVRNLTKREMEVWQLLVAGFDRQEIAGQLYCSPETVRTHVRNLIAKVGVHSKLEVVALGLRLGIEP